MTTNAELHKLQAALVAFARARDWEKYHSPRSFAVALTVEAAELLAPFTWASDADSVRMCEDAATKARLESEVGDVLINLLQFAYHANIDVTAAAWAKLAKLEARYDPATQKAAGGYVKIGEDGVVKESLPRE